MDYEKINLKIVIKGIIYVIPCSIAVTPDKDKLVFVFKQEQAGAVKELLANLVEEGKRYE